MRTPALVLATLLLIPLALVPTAEARTIFCTSVTNPNCPGDVCVDHTLDGRIQPHECAELVCGVAGCCDPCVPPDAPASSCKEVVVGGTPAGVIVGYGLSGGCPSVTLRTCELTYYPGEPNTPVWICRDRAILG